MNHNNMVTEPTVTAFTASPSRRHVTTSLPWGQEEGRREGEVGGCVQVEAEGSEGRQGKEVCEGSV